MSVFIPARRCRFNGRPTYVLDHAAHRRALLLQPAAASPALHFWRIIGKKSWSGGLLSGWPPSMNFLFYVPRLSRGSRAYAMFKERNLELLVTFAGGDAERTRRRGASLCRRLRRLDVATATSVATIVIELTPYVNPGVMVSGRLIPWLPVAVDGMPDPAAT